MYIVYVPNRNVCKFLVDKFLNESGIVPVIVFLAVFCVEGARNRIAYEMLATSSYKTNKKITANNIMYVWVRYLHKFNVSILTRLPNSVGILATKLFRPVFLEYGKN